MTNWISDTNILIVGLGLMGGSYAKALSRLGFSVRAIDRDAESIRYAVGEGLISEGSVHADPGLIESADVIIFALYPGILPGWIEENQRYFRPGAVLTDVTGVKSCIVYKIQELLREDVEFIAAHPMAGRERSGVENADDRMFYGANYIVTPTEKNTEEAILWCENLGRLLGCRRISRLSPEEHDRMIGFVSQLTHCVAVAMMTSCDSEKLADYTGDSFRDLTRIARINDTMWSELFLMNKTALLPELDAFIEEMKTLRDMVDRDDRDGLREKMKLSSRRRAVFDLDREKR